MTDLARTSAVPIKRPSSPINSSLHLNFDDFINQVRIEDSKHLLKQIHDIRKTILEIAYEVGFNSMSTFNQAFDKITGIIPSEVQKQHSLSRVIASREVLPV